MPRISTLIHPILIVLALSSVAQANTINVPGDQPSIQQAIDNANQTGTTIVVDPGTYDENIDTKGKAVIIKSDSTKERPTIKALDTSTSVITITQGEGPDTVIQGFNIRNSSTSVGGGILIVSSSPTIEDCEISKNSATVSGGGVFITGSSASPKFVNCHIRKNVSVEYGGGVAIEDSAQAEFELCTFQRNAAGNGPLSDGGGLALVKGTCILKGCHFNKNAAERRGGGIFAKDHSVSILRVENCTFQDNHASEGGGFYGEGLADISVSYCKIKDNVATFNGGGIMLDDSTNNQVRFCDIKHNSAFSEGGGLFVYGENTEINFCVITKNFANSGGGIVSEKAKTKARDSRICNNEGGNTRGKVKAKSNTKICSN